MLSACWFDRHDKYMIWCRCSCVGDGTWDWDLGHQHTNTRHLAGELCTLFFYYFFHSLLYLTSPFQPMIRPISILLIFFVTFTSATSFSLSDRPTLKYGTAWKKEATADLVFKAVIHGFRRQLFVMFDFFLAVLCLCDQYK